MFLLLMSCWSLDFVIAAQAMILWLKLSPNVISSMSTPEIAFLLIPTLLQPFLNYCLNSIQTLTGFLISFILMEQRKSWDMTSQCQLHTTILRIKRPRGYQLVYNWTDHIIKYNAAAAAAKSLQSCPTLCDPIDSSPPGFPVPGILQARTLE